MELQQLDAEAKKAAIDSIKTMLQRPDQLEKIDQYRHREGRKMASMEMVVRFILVYYVHKYDYIHPPITR